MHVQCALHKNSTTNIRKPLFSHTHFSSHSAALFICKIICFLATAATEKHYHFNFLSLLTLSLSSLSAGCCDAVHCLCVRTLRDMSNELSTYFFSLHFHAQFKLRKISSFFLCSFVVRKSFAHKYQVVMRGRQKK